MKGLWHGLPIVLNNRVRQRTGSRLKGAKASIDGLRMKRTREYEIGDSPRSLSFRDMAKFDEEIVWENYPERSALVVILLDASASENIGSGRTKFAAGLELVRGFARACLYKNHKVVLITFTDRIEFESPVITRLNSLERTMDEIGGFVTVGERTHPKICLERAIAMADRANEPADMVCLVSDLLFDDPCLSTFSVLTEATDVVAWVVGDRVEQRFPSFMGAVMLRDSETGETFYASGLTSDNLAEKLENLGVDVCRLETGDGEADFFHKLKDFFTSRQKKGGRA